MDIRDVTKTRKARDSQPHVPDKSSVRQLSQQLTKLNVKGKWQRFELSSNLCTGCYKHRGHS